MVLIFADEKEVFVEKVGKMKEVERSENTRQDVNEIGVDGTR